MTIRRWISAAAALAMAVTPLMACAETTINPEENRGIVLQQVGDNNPIEGISPTTGRVLADLEQPDGFNGLAITGRYMPMMVQVDNADGGIGYRAPWAMQYADVVYETPLYRAGDTRISAIFSDLIPDAMGPIRSARVGHVWIREEWDCGFLYYGGQEYARTNIVKEFKKLGADQKGVLFSGIVGTNHPWKKYYYVRTKPKLAAPHNKGANVAAMCDLIPEEHVAKNHTWLFTDEPLQGDDATSIYVEWTKERTIPEYNSRLVYDPEENNYKRYILKDPANPALYVELDTQEAIDFENVIIQFTKTKFYAKNAPKTYNVGEGNADFFMDGKHMAGYWKRASMSERTIFYDTDGNELKLHPGRTFIIMLPLDKTVTYE